MELSNGDTEVGNNWLKYSGMLHSDLEGGVDGSHPPNRMWSGKRDTI
jgi:hypothetical protein